jgi:phosphoenolpyruvate carboxykinase (ATP)
MRGEGRPAATGALAVETGEHTGRAAADKFIVKDMSTERTVWWATAKPLTPESFDILLRDFLLHEATRDLFVQDLYVGADPTQRVRVRIYCEHAWHALFIRQLLIQPHADELASFAPELTIIDFPSFRADPERHGGRCSTMIACDFAHGLVLIGGTAYAGEIKKAVFSYLNYVLPERGVLPMHCSASEALSGGEAAIFLGLSGTGKTTLSADSRRTLIGDDEHGWSESGLYNFEGGCYAKTIGLSSKAQPEIYAAVNRWGAVLENVVLDADTNEPLFDDASLTENARGAYPLDFIANSSETGRSDHPRNIVMLTADAFGVLPPIAHLTPDQAVYYFLSGYTAKLAGTEQGVSEPEVTFSACFGAPFMPRHPSVYGAMFRERIIKHGVDCWLVNTGWTGGKYGVGRRLPLKVTRRLLDAALSGELKPTAMRIDAAFGFKVPEWVGGVYPNILRPRTTWPDQKEFAREARALVGLFAANFAKFEDDVDPQVRAAAPCACDAA